MPCTRYLNMTRALREYSHRTLGRICRDRIRCGYLCLGFSSVYILILSIVIINRAGKQTAASQA
jgi:hypothetical protein